MKFLMILAILPSLVIAYLINRADTKEKEPKMELLKAFFLGFLSIVLTLIISIIFNITKINIDNMNLVCIFLYSFICISLVEELSKWLCTYLFIKNNKNFDYLFDGIVYASFVALGFATLENILYALSGGITTVIVRAITTVPAHAFFGISSGYYLSLAKKDKLNNGNKYFKYLALSLFVPSLLHGFYDFCLLTENGIFLIIYIVFIVSLYVFSIGNIKKMSKNDSLFLKKKCKYCGKVIEGKYCSNCGNEVEE